MNLGGDGRWVPLFSGLDRRYCTTAFLLFFIQLTNKKRPINLFIHGCEPKTNDYACQ